jgi:NAD(P)-dependent dehydrogenase (short-subunit alcohol dehydrogenase family)
MAKRFLVIGGNSGIGAACVSYIEERIRRKDEIFYPGVPDLDVRSFNSVDDYFKRVAPTHLVYCAGINYLEWIGQLDEASVEEVLNVNLTGFIRCIDAMKSHQGSDNPSVVAITSDAAWRPMRTSIAYCSSKAGLEMAVRVASRELAPQGWRVNAVAPGKVGETAMTDYVDGRVLELRGWTKERGEEYERNSSALGRNVTKEEVAQTVWQVLVGPLALTGETVAVNGGR